MERRTSFARRWIRGGGWRWSGGLSFLFGGGGQGSTLPLETKKNERAHCNNCSEVNCSHAGATGADGAVAAHPQRRLASSCWMTVSRQECFFSPPPSAHRLVSCGKNVEANFAIQVFLLFVVDDFPTFAWKTDKSNLHKIELSVAEAETQNQTI